MPGFQHGTCCICGTEYKKCTFRVQSDSHHSYEEFHPCPHCGCGADLTAKIKAILEEEVSVTLFAYDNSMAVNIGDSEEKIMALIKKAWPMTHKKK